MSFFTNLIRMGQRVLGKRRKPDRTRPQNQFVPCLEYLEDRVVLSSYYWRPDPDLSATNQTLVSRFENWRIGGWGSANPVATEKPDADDKLYFTPGGNCALFDPNANGTYAAIFVHPDVGYTIKLERNITFDSSGNGSGSVIASQIFGGTIDVEPGDSFTMTFSGSPLTLSDGNFVRVSLINSAGNTVTMTGGQTDFSFGACKFDNRGTVNWSGDGIWEFEEATFDNSGTLNASPSDVGRIRAGNVFGGTFNNLAGGVINVIGNGTACVIANGVNGNGDAIEIVFTNAGNMNFTDGSATTFETSQFSQSAGAAVLSDASIVNVQTFTVNGGTVGGSGTIVGNLQVGQATVRPGTTTTAGVLNVTGNVTMGGQTQTSILITGNNTSSQLVVTGTVSLGGTLTVAVANGVNINANQSWPIITGTRQGQFAAPATQPAGFSAPTYNNNSVAVQNPEMQSCGPQVTNEDIVLVFSAANNNAILFPIMPIAGLAERQIQLVAFNGTTTLGSTSGLTFLTGTGSGDTEMTFTGTIDDINAALEGLSFLPSANYNGPASLDINVSDTYPSGGTYYDANTVLIRQRYLHCSCQLWYTVTP